jgi:hypothetical protein
VIRYSDRVKGHPFRFNLSQRLRDGVLNALAFIGSRMINADFDIDLPSPFIGLSWSVLSAHCRFGLHPVPKTPS